MNMVLLKKSCETLTFHNECENVSSSSSVQRPKMLRSEGIFQHRAFRRVLICNVFSFDI